MALDLTTQVRTRITAMGAIFVPILASLFSLPVAFDHRLTHQTQLTAALAFALAGTVAGIALGLIGISTKEDLQISENGVKVKVPNGVSNRDLMRGSIRRWEILHERDGTCVRLGSLLMDLDVLVKDDEAATELLRALAIDSNGREAATLWDWRPDLVQAALAAIASIFAAGMLSLFAPGAWGVALPLLAIIIPLLAATFRLLRGRTTISIGDDGLQLTNAFGGSRFVPHREIASVRAEASELHVVLNNGEDIVFIGPPHLDDEGAVGRHVSDVAARVVLRRENRPDAAEAPELARAGRTTRDWLDALKRIGKNIEPSFRSASVPRDVLWRVVESADSSEEERVAAAVALRTGGLGDDDRPRLRVAMDNCAHDELRQRFRIALESEEDEALEKALDPLAQRNGRL